MRADANAGSALGHFAVRNAERWRFEETSTMTREQRKGQVAASMLGTVASVGRRLFGVGLVGVGLVNLRSGLRSFASLRMTGSWLIVGWQAPREIGLNQGFAQAATGLEGGLHLSSARDCKIPDNVQAQRKDRRHASPRPGCKLQESRRLWTARKKWREIVRRMPCPQKWTYVRADASPLVNSKKTRVPTAGECLQDSRWTNRWLRFVAQVW